MEIAVLALGCFWGPEKKFGKIDGIVETEVGYCGGKISNVTYPGIQGHKQRDIAQKQMNGYGGMITFLYDGTLSEISKFMKKHPETCKKYWQKK